MEEIYLVTGVTGFLGREVAKQLIMQQKKEWRKHLESLCLLHHILSIH